MSTGKFIVAALFSCAVTLASPASADEITKAAALFAENCVSKLPNMRGVQAKVAETVQTQFGGNGIHSEGRTTYSGNLRGASIFYQSSAVTKTGFNICKVSVNRVDQQKAIQALLNAFTENAPRGVKLVEAQDPYGLVFYRKITGTAHTMTLEANTGRKKSAFILIAWK